MGQRTQSIINLIFKPAGISNTQDKGAVILKNLGGKELAEIKEGLKVF